MRALVKEPVQSGEGNGRCPGGAVCPLSRVNAGSAVRIKRLAAPPEVCQRLRELGLCEEHQIKLLQSGCNLICLVCNARLALSSQMGESIFVEPIPRAKTTA